MNTSGTCRETAQRISDYLDGEMVFWKRWRIWYHLKQCPPCERWLKSIQATIKAVGAARNVEQTVSIPPELKAKIERIFSM